MRSVLILLGVACLCARAHDAHGRSTAPPEARLLKSPLAASEEHAAAAKVAYERFCVGCHGSDGRSRTALAANIPVRPTNLSEYLMESMRDGEIFWVIGNGIAPYMPSFGAHLSATQRWELVQYVRRLRQQQRIVEKQKLGPYAWDLPPGFPLPNVPADNPMTDVKVELGRYLFYDKTALAQSDPILRHVPPAGEGLHRRPRSWSGFNRGDPSARPDEPRERRL